MAKKMSVSGDLGARRASAESAFFGRKIKRAGATNENPLRKQSKVLVESTPVVIGSLPGPVTVGGFVGGPTTGIRAPRKASSA